MAKNHWQKAAGKPAQKMPGAAPIAPPPLPQTDLTKAAESLSPEAVPQTDLSQVEESAIKMADEIMSQPAEQPPPQGSLQQLSEDIMNVFSGQGAGEAVDRFGQPTGRFPGQEVVQEDVPQESTREVSQDQDQGQEQGATGGNVVEILTAIATSLDQIKEMMSEMKDGGEYHG